MRRGAAMCLLVLTTCVSRLRYVCVCVCACACVCVCVCVCVCLSSHSSNTYIQLWMNDEFVWYWHPHVGLTFERFVILHVHASCHTRDTMFSCVTDERFTLTMTHPSAVLSHFGYGNDLQAPWSVRALLQKRYNFFSFSKPTHCCHFVVYARIFFPRTQCTIAFFCCCHPRVVIRICSGLTTPSGMGWLRFVGSLKLCLSFAKEPSKRDDILQKRPIIWRSLPIVANPWVEVVRSDAPYVYMNQCV